VNDECSLEAIERVRDTLSGTLLVYLGWYANCRSAGTSSGGLDESGAPQCERKVARPHVLPVQSYTVSDLKFRIAGILHDTKSIAVDVLQASRQNERPGVVQL